MDLIHLCSVYLTVQNIWILICQDNNGLIRWENENINLNFNWLPGHSVGSVFKLWLGKIACLMSYYLVLFVLDFILHKYWCIICYSLRLRWICGLWHNHFSLYKEGFWYNWSGYSGRGFGFYGCELCFIFNGIFVDLDYQSWLAWVRVWTSVSWL